jgi:hypothetical protein
MGTWVHGPGTGPGNAFKTDAAVFQEAVDHLPPGHWPMGGSARIAKDRPLNGLTLMGRSANLGTMFHNSGENTTCSTASIFY